jgi:hypothetical protein
MHVLEHDHEGLLVRQLVHDEAEALDRRPLSFGYAAAKEIRHPAGRWWEVVDGALVEGGPQSLTDRLEGDSQVEVEAVTGQHGEAALASAFGDRMDERRLADAGVAADEQGLGLARCGRGQGLVGLVQLAVSPEQAVWWSVHGAAYAPAIRAETGALQCRSLDGTVSGSFSGVGRLARHQAVRA